jgi:molybdate transport system substrate-binding protein
MFNRVTKRCLTIAVAAMCLSATPYRAHAAEPLSVLSAGAAASVVKEIARDYERATGRTVIVTEGTVGQIRAKLATGVPADVVILSAPALDALAKNGDLVDGTRADLGRTGIGIGVRAGSAPLDLSTPAALKATLLNATSIASTDPASGASSGTYFAGVLQQLGISSEVQSKEQLVQGGLSCDLVASGKAQLCVQNISEIVPVHGVVLGAPFPEAMQNHITYAAAVEKRTSASADAGAFIAYATSPERAALWKRGGFEH